MTVASPLLKHVAGLFKKAAADVEISETGPQSSNLVSELTNATSYHRVNIQAVDFFWMSRDNLT